MLTRITPILPVVDVRAELAFYRRLGFTQHSDPAEDYPEEEFAAVARGDGILFGLAVSDHPVPVPPSGLDWQFETTDIEAVARAAAAADLEVSRPVTVQPWGRRMMTLVSPNGYAVNVEEAAPSPPATQPPVGEATSRLELDLLTRWLRDLRSSVARKADGLSPEQLASRSVPPSGLSVLGLVRHLAQLEHFWFVNTLSRSEEERPYVPAGDWDAQFRDAVPDQAVVDDAVNTWRAVCARADGVLASLEPGDLNVVWAPDDRTGSVRGALLQVIYEYSRHCGHLDLLREAVDGQTGE